MTYRQAAYFRLMLLCGQTEEFVAFVDSALLEEDPISDVALDLAFCYTDPKESLSVLNGYLADIGWENIDSEELYEDVRRFLGRQYTEKGLPFEETLRLTEKLALAYDAYPEPPWSPMTYATDVYADVQEGYIDREAFVRRVEDFWINGTELSFSDLPTVRKKSFFSRLCAGFASLFKK